MQHHWLTAEAVAPSAAATATVNLARQLQPGIGPSSDGRVAAPISATTHAVANCSSSCDGGTRPSSSLLNAILGIPLRPCSLPLFQCTEEAAAGNWGKAMQLHAAQPAQLLHPMQSSHMLSSAVARQQGWRIDQGESGPMGRVLNSSVLANMPAAEMSTLSLFKAITNHG